MKNGFLYVIFGLMVFVVFACQDKEEEVSYSIGQSYGGGIIFYIDDTELHGLICAPYDQSEGATWSNGNDMLTLATGTGFGTGVTNTKIIVEAQGEGNYAAKICSDLVLNGYSDWFLPSKSECFQMYYKLALINNIGNFSDTLYWSSTEASIGNAYSQYGNDGYPPNGGYYKTELHRVRAIRAF